MATKYSRSNKYALKKASGGVNRWQKKTTSKDIPTYVVLSNAPNPDLEKGYWCKMGRPKPKKIRIKSFKEASKVAQDYIERYRLGMGNWTGGDILNSAGRVVGYVSFNGRVWESRSYAAKEIKVGQEPVRYTQKHHNY